MARIFISYRRDDTGGYAGRLFDRLSTHFGRGNIFMDVDTIEPGLDFVRAIERAVGSCDVLLALIGQQWSSRRLHNDQDFIRLEIATALKRDIRVIPLLIHGAPMPSVSDLPNDLRALTRRNALEISDVRFHSDVDRLIEVLDRVLGTTPNRVPQQVKKEPAADISSSEKTDFFETPVGKVLGVLILAFIVWFILPGLCNRP
jgi:TIR domain